jgi:hypothetical protein
MLETIWPLPCEVSVPAMETEGQRGAVSSGSSNWKGRRGSRTLFQDDNRRCLAPERHSEAGWAVGMVLRVVTELQTQLQAEKRVCGGVLVSGVNALLWSPLLPKKYRSLPPAELQARSLQRARAS